ncbi:uncharacterized protein LACBIDRAFT_313898 [Laccaria bicolor S238N-H82]|uniref:Predicted protein n=1 Tax=Laccaria bicolor (strain S238N-H82 / ATCC MYA-4686) TaxID=486041 RepID=B0D134_LACBS|nr:uncharacterized protein LACBIDRAFT_313898 [Laccaria bicolor S238N-H82]EDR11563.1 predicted protein [Laccaria bicolor S238N-H82]|eukprot:XP_001877460.1 predicted protein [Laccaria bicolor S238N-H82]
MDGLAGEVGAAIFVTLDRGGLCVAREGFCTDFFTRRSACVSPKTRRRGGLVRLRQQRSRNSGFSCVGWRRVTIEQSG